MFTYMYTEFTCVCVYIYILCVSVCFRYVYQVYRCVYAEFVCMCVYIYIHVRQIQMWVCMYLHICTHMRINVYIHVCFCTCVYGYIYIYLYVCERTLWVHTDVVFIYKYVYTYWGLYVCVYVCTPIHICIQRRCMCIQIRRSSPRGGVIVNKCHKWPRHERDLTRTFVGGWFSKGHELLTNEYVGFFALLSSGHGPLLGYNICHGTATFESLECILSVNDSLSLANSLDRRTLRTGAEFSNRFAYQIL